MTFVFVMLAWVFFRSQSISEAVYVFTSSISITGGLLQFIKQGFKNVGISKSALLLICITLLVLALYDYVSALANHDAIDILRRKNNAVRWMIYLAAGLAVIFLSPKGVATEFVYFQF